MEKTELLNFEGHKLFPRVLMLKSRSGQTSSIEKEVTKHAKTSEHVRRTALAL